MLAHIPMIAGSLTFLSARSAQLEHTLLSREPLTFQIVIHVLGARTPPCLVSLMQTCVRSVDLEHTLAKLGRIPSAHAHPVKLESSRRPLLLILQTRVQYVALEHGPMWLGHQTVRNALLERIQFRLGRLTVGLASFVQLVLTLLCLEPIHPPRVEIVDLANTH